LPDLGAHPSPHDDVGYLTVSAGCTYPGRERKKRFLYQKVVGVKKRCFMKCSVENQNECHAKISSRSACPSVVTIGKDVMILVTIQSL
jgi:hypothetical protein